ncbi:hypothetical protein MJH12_14880, partial [bacterium]|nr:hypothetical protein [bacterium]
KYSILVGLDSDSFTIDASSGLILFNSYPDYENPSDLNNDGSYELLVRVSDPSFDSTTGRLKVSLNNVDEKPILNPIAQITRSEDFSSFTYTLSANDVDDDPITYSMSQSDELVSYNTIANNIISFSPYLNQHGSNTIEITATANGKSDIQTFLFVVDSVNDAPMILNTLNAGRLEVSVSENQRLVITISAGDIESDPLSYSLINGQDSNLFEINVNSGVVFFKKKPNYEDPKDLDSDGVYDFSVQVTNSNDVSVLTSFPIQVTLINEDDLPIFTYLSDQKLLEDFDAFHIALITTDEDIIDNTSYQMSMSTSSVVSAVLQTNSIILSSLTNQSGHATIYVTATSNGKIVEQSFNIDVQAINDTPIFVHSLDDGVIVTAVFENQNFAFDLIASDPDHTSLTYSILAGLDSQSFTMTTSTGYIQFKTAPDYEITSDNNSDGIYEIHVMVSDAMSAHTSQLLRISIVNVDEAPQLQKITHKSRFEDFSPFSLSLNAKDQDGDDIVYSYTQTNSLIVDLTITGNQLHFVHKSNLFGNTQIKITARANGKSDQIQFSFLVNPINDAPILTNSLQNGVLVLNVSENEVQIQDLNAHDIESDPVVFELKSSLDSSFFTIDASSGLLRFYQAANFENPLDNNHDNEYSCVILLRDSNDASVFTSYLTIIKVLNVNDVPILQNPQNRVLDEDFGTYQVALQASDEDTVDSITYAFQRDSTMVQANLLGNVLTIQSKANQNGVVNFVVQAFSGIDVVEQSFSILIKAVNDVPVLTNPHQDHVLTEIVYENQKEVMSLAAKDIESNASLFKLQNSLDSSAFELDAFSGQLTFKIAPNFEDPLDQSGSNVYQSIVHVQDSRDSSIYTSYLLKVEVKDRNDLPVITAQEDIFTQEGFEDFQLVLNGFDEDPSSVLTYSLLSSPNHLKATLLGNVLSLSSLENLYGQDLFQIQLSSQNQSVFLSFTIRVQSINDVPRFINPLNQGKVVVEAPENKLRVIDLDAFDLENEAFTFSLLAEQDGALFHINPDNGILSFINKPNFEEALDSNQDNYYELIAVVRDSADSKVFSTQAMQIHVWDVEEAAILIDLPALEKDEDFDFFKIDLTELSKSYSDLITYKLLLSDQNMISATIVDTNLLISSKENKNGTVNIRILASTEERNADKSFVVKILAINDAPLLVASQRSSKLETSIIENSKFIMDFEAFDIENEEILYSIVSSKDSEFFSLNTSSGRIAFKRAPNFEDAKDQNKDNVYDLVVRVSDGSLYTTQAVEVSVVNTDESATFVLSSSVNKDEDFLDFSIPLESNDE